MSEQNKTMSMVTNIISAYVSNNAVAASDLASLITQVHKALNDISLIEDAEQPVNEELPKPAISIKKSVTPEYIVCLEDGKKFKSLKRHLRTHYSMTPEEYRQRWGLDKSYPMIAPRYSTERSNLAKKMGLGQKKLAPGIRRK